MELAFKKGTEDGRHGLGSIFVKAAGNGRDWFDNCAFEEECSSIFTIKVGAVHRDNLPASYSEACSAVLVSAYAGSILEEDELVSAHCPSSPVHHFSHR